MFSVFADSSLLASVHPVQILIGQYIDGHRSGKRPAKTEYLLFQSIQCEDVDVAAEQIDCIEEVLPTSLQVLGVYTDASYRRKIENLLKDHHNHDELLAVEKKENGFVAHHFGTKQSSTITLGKLDFCQFSCSVFSCVSPLPVLLTTADSKEIAVALDEESALSDLGVTEKVLGGRQLGALPGKCMRCTIPLVLNLQHTRGCDLFRCLLRYIEKAQRRGTACVQVQSKAYTGLVFCCFCKELSVPLSEAQWQTISEMIGDAVGESVAKTQLIGTVGSTTSLQNSAKARQPHPENARASGTAQLSTGGGNSMVLYAGAIVLVLAVFLIWLRS